MTAMTFYPADNDDTRIHSSLIYNVCVYSLNNLSIAIRLTHSSNNGNSYIFLSENSKIKWAAVQKFARSYYSELF